MERYEFRHNGLKLSYLDAGGDGPVIVALHAHGMEASTFAPIAAALAPEWRVVALDQRGQGHSDHAKTYMRDDYLGDLYAFLDHLGIVCAVIWGNSLGGVNAYQFAARHPDRVRALVIEDMGVEVDDDTSFFLKWEGTFGTRDELAERVGARMLPYFQDSFRETPEGWRLAFDPADMVASQGFVNGNHWKDWLATDCPALIIRGLDSRVTTQAHVEQMASRRPNTQLRSIAGGHVIHFDNPPGFTETLRLFLRGLSS